MEDLLGVGKSADKIIEAVSRAVGAIYRPYGIRREADAEAYRLIAIERAKAAALEKQTRAGSAGLAVVIADTEEQLQERAQRRLANEVLHQQRNVDSVVQEAINQGTTTDSDEEIDLDWLNSFFDLAKNVSVKQMQALWGKVLAKEIGQPGSFTVRALETLKRITRPEALTFSRACALASRDPDETTEMILTGWTGAPDAIARRFSSTWRQSVELRHFGLEYLDCKSLTQIGLLYSGELVFGPFNKGQSCKVEFARSTLLLSARRKKTQLTCFQFTPIGSELATLISPDENAAYIGALHRVLEKGFSVVATERAPARA